jgi:hypothetical protein
MVTVWRLAIATRSMLDVVNVGVAGVIATIVEHTSRSISGTRYTRLETAPVGP